MIREFFVLQEKIEDAFGIVSADHLFSFLKRYGKEKGIILAGGAMRYIVDPDEDEICDFDLFFTDDEAVNFVKEYLESSSYTNTFSCPKGELFSYSLPYDNDCFIKVQLINKRVYDDVYDLLESFDFTACQFAWDGETFYTSRQAVKDVKKKYLRLHRMTFPTATFKRMYKYRGKGYYIGDCIKDSVLAVNLMINYDPENDKLYVD